MFTISSNPSGEFWGRGTMRYMEPISGRITLDVRIAQLPVSQDKL